MVEKKHGFDLISDSENEECDKNTSRPLYNFDNSQPIKSPNIYTQRFFENRSKS
jgi:hypothetical protein